MSIGSNPVAAKRQPWTYTKEETIRVEDMYPGGISIPPGYEEVGFAPPKADQPYVPAYTPRGYRVSSASQDYPPDRPRILLKQKDLCFNVGDCFKSDKDIFYRVLDTASDHFSGMWVTYQTLSVTGEVRRWEAAEDLLKAAWNKYDRVTSAEWRGMILERCCS